MGVHKGFWSSLRDPWGILRRWGPLEALSEAGWTTLEILEILGEKLATHAAMWLCRVQVVGMSHSEEERDATLEAILQVT